jgi:hypothetical protein
VARTRTLQDLVADVRWASDTEPATIRHTDKQIVRALNQSQQAFRLMISEAGHPYYTELYEESSIAAGASLLTLANVDVDPFVAILGMDIDVGGEWREMFPFQLSERNNYQSNTASDGIPTHYRHRVIQTNDVIVDVMPVADATYPVRLWLLPNGIDFSATYTVDDAISTSSSIFDGIAGWEDWIVYDTALRITARDANISDNYEVLAAEFARVEQRVMKWSKQRVRNGPGRRLDTRGRREAIELANATRWVRP